MLFTAAPIHRSKSKYGGLVSGAAALGQRRHRPLTSRRVLAQLVEYQVPPGMESKLPVTVPDEAPPVPEKVVLARLVEYQPPAAMEMEAASSDGSGDGTVVVLVLILIASVAATIYGLATKGKSDGAAAAPTPAPPATATSATAQSSTPSPASTATSTAATEPAAFATGQRVSLLGPPKMVGKVGSIVDFIGTSTVAVQLESGSIFHFAMENIQHAAAATPLPTQAAEDQEFAPGQHVTLLHPPALAGKTGSIFQHAGDEIYAVMMSSGSIFHFPAKSLQDATPVRAY